MLEFFKNLFGKTDAFDVYDVFTPTRPASLTFVERNEIDYRLISALNMPGEVVIVYGHSGCGKTTLVLNKLKSKFKSYIVSRCTRTTKFEELLLDAFDQLNKFYVQKISDKDSGKLAGEIEGGILSLKSKMSSEKANEHTQDFERVVRYQINESNLAKSLNELNCCWIIEDFHKVDTTEKGLLSDCLKAFYDEKAKVIPIGAVGTAREVVESNSEMTGRVSEILVSLMRDEQLFEIINKGELLLNIRFEPSVKNKIIKFSSGLASVCHRLCLNTCIEKGIIQTSKKPMLMSDIDFLKGVNRYVFDNSDSLKKAYDKAINFIHKGDESFGKELIKIMLSLGKDEFTEIEIINLAERRLSSVAFLEATEILIDEFTTEKRGSILRFDENSNKYSFNNPFFVAYCYCMFEGEINGENKNAVIENSKNVIQGSKISVRGDVHIGDSNVTIGDISKGGDIKIKINK